MEEGLRGRTRGCSYCQKCIVEGERKRGRADRQVPAVGQTRMETQEQSSPSGKTCSPTDRVDRGSVEVGSWGRVKLRITML